MTDKTEHAIRTGEEAARILEHPLVVQAFAQLRHNVYAQWQQTRIGGLQERETLYHLHTAVMDFEAHFQSLVTDGKFADARLEQAEREAAASGHLKHRT